MRDRLAELIRPVTLLAALMLVLGDAAGAQERMRGFERRVTPPDDVDFTVLNVPYDGRFAFVRLSFTPDWAGWGGGGGFFGGVNYQWDHDYPRAERHFTTMLRELTATDAITAESNIFGLTDPELFRYPVAYMSEPGHWTMTEEEVEAFRTYLLKGGFVIFDDFQGQHWFNFQEQIRRVLPDHRLVQLDASHPIFHSFFEIETLEHFVHPLSYVPSSFFGVYEDNDPDKRLLLIANYNNDIGESWEWSDRGFIPIDLTNEAYKLGINYIVYALAH